LARLVFRVHALERMFERGIGVDDVKMVLADGKDIETYADDSPYPSRLVLGWVGERPLHVVVADDYDEDLRIVVTVYEPDPALWDDGFERRKAQ
jgi:hypothetical protein